MTINSPLKVMLGLAITEYDITFTYFVSTVLDRKLPK